MKRTHFIQQTAFFSLTLIIVSAAPVSAGWLQDAIGDFINETLADSKVVGVSLAAVGFIWGCLAYVFGWGSLKGPVVAIVVGAVIGLADTFIGA
ncbi:hypothetical protein [Ruegeria sp. SCP11]|uniref:hypothetical protein n=1 Tax=Ruegeria sp. SCP11 TaxID=3141378 RepID=UPI00333D6A58